MMASAPPRRALFRTSIRWAALLLLSLVQVAALEAIHIPAALLLAPMAAGVLAAAAGWSLGVPRWAYLPAQAIVGCLIARGLTPAIFSTVAAHALLFFGMVSSVILASSLLGWLLARWRVLPGSAAVWGSSPGAATTMTVMAEAHGADVRLVAFMQYLRVVFVAITATLVARLWTAPGAPSAVAMTWFPPVSWTNLIGTAAVAGVGGALGLRLRVPAGALLVPLALSAALQASGAMTVELPPWLLAPSYAIIGWSVGLRFTPTILLHVAHALPRVAVSIAVQIATCAGLAFLLNRLIGVDLLTAYLATSPGGADSVAIIAASTKVDLPFVMAMQTSRLLLVILISPYLARFIVGRLAGREEVLSRAASGDIKA